MSARVASLYARSAARETGRADALEGELKARATAKIDADYSAERTLVQAAQRDRSRFADLYEANFERVYAYVVRRVRDRDEAQDVTADVFHLALKSLPRFEWRGVPFAAWLFRIAANEIADRSKSVARRRAHELENSYQANPCRRRSGIEYRRGGAARAAVQTGRAAAAGSVAGDHDAVCGGQVDSRDCDGARPIRGQRQAASIPRHAEFAGAVG